MPARQADERLIATLVETNGIPPREVVVGGHDKVEGFLEQLGGRDVDVGAHRSHGDVARAVVQLLDHLLVRSLTRANRTFGCAAR